MLLSCALIAGCTSAPLDSSGERVMVVDGISATDLLSYDYVTQLHSEGMQSVEFCRNDLRNQAAQKGAAIVRITSIEPDYCAFDALQHGSPKNCFSAHADAFKPKPAK